MQLYPDMYDKYYPQIDTDNANTLKQSLYAWRDWMITKELSWKEEFYLSELFLYPCIMELQKTAQEMSTGFTKWLFNHNII